MLDWYVKTVLVISCLEGTEHIVLTFVSVQIQRFMQVDGQD